jgi:hypothetical protein
MSRAGSPELEIQTLGQRAHHAAKQRLIENHREEFSQLLGDERELRGLPRDRIGPSYHVNRALILESQLRSLGVEPEA